MPGPKRQSNAVKLAKGTQPCRLNKGEIEAPLGVGPAPDWFDTEAKALWARIVELAPPNVLTSADALAIEQMVLVAFELAECRRLIRQHGMVVEEDRGSGDVTYTITKANPLLPTLIRLRKQFLDLANCYGFTASSRASLSAEPPKKPSALAEFVMNGGKAKDG